MPHTPYDPKKAHDYYMRIRQLKGRKAGALKPGAPKVTSASRQKAAVERVHRLRTKTTKLSHALSDAQKALRKARQSETKTEKKNSDGKTTVKERQTAKKSRDKNEAKTKAASKSSSSGKKANSSNDVSSMSVADLQVRIGKIKAALKSARSQLNKAQQAVGQLAHADMSASGVLLNSVTLQPPIRRKDSVNMTDADFSGYATRNDLRCSDGRTILADAFKENDGQIVPLVWAHGHDDVDNVLGHVKLENRADGVYAHAFFNATAKGQNAKEQVRHGDIRFLSIFANNLVEKLQAGFKAVVHGSIKEVSLVLAGANPGAFIDNVNLVHGDGTEEVFAEEAYITTGLEIELSHADTATLDKTDASDETAQDILETLNAKQKEAVYYLLSQALTMEGDSVKHGDIDADDADAEGDADDNSADSDVDADADGEADADADADAEGDADENSDDSDADGDAADDADGNAEGDIENEAGDAVQHDNTNTKEDDSMTHNVFDQAKKDSATRQQITLSHDDVKGIVSDAVKGGSLKGAIEGYALSHGIENIDYLFPDAKTLENSPAFLSRRMEWVDQVLNSVRKSPFSRIKTITADITPDEARARGYIKGNMKNEEYFALAKRTTTPQTVYKKQKLDRDDVIDITDLDVVAWLKAEMKVMLDEEIAGAILIGDGRSAGDDDKILETNIRPIASDAELYVTTANVNLDDASSSVEELVDAVISHRQYYKGSGQPAFYTTEAIISAFLTVKDSFGRRIYGSIQEVASVLRVSAIVPVEIMERVPDVVGIMVNLADYTLGADRGGMATMFDDFDIDYNKLRYLIETRVSGALTQPKSAIVFRKVASANVLVNPNQPAFNQDTNVLTVPTQTGVVYKNAAGTTLTTGAPVTITADDSPYHVVATPASGYYFADNANDEWDFEYEA